MKKEYHILIVLVSFWCLGIIAAPLVYGSLISDFLYRLYSIICHQFDSRSFHLFDHAFAVCIRCTSIYFSFLVTMIFVRLFETVRMQKVNTKKVLMITALPIFMDGVLSLLNVVESDSISRIVTGSLFGIGMALLLHESIAETIKSFVSIAGKSYEIKT